VSSSAIPKNFICFIKTMEQKDGQDQGKNPVDFRQTAQGLSGIAIRVVPIFSKHRKKILCCYAEGALSGFLEGPLLFPRKPRYRE